MNRRIPNLLLILLLVLQSFALLLPSSGSDWIIDGDIVYFEDDNVYLSVQPHTIIQDTWITFKLRSKNYSGDIDACWLFNTTNCKPTKPVYCKVGDGNWTELTKEFTIKNITNDNFENMTKAYLLENINIQNNINYSLKCFVDIKFNTSGKYWWGVKPSALGWDKGYYLDPWWNSNWDFFRKITIDSSYIDNTLTDFPLLVVLDNSTIHVDSNKSIRFVSTDNTTEFYYEIEKWNDAGNCFIWVNISEGLTSGSDYEFLMYYNNTAATDNQNPTNVWDSNYVLVHHMNGSSHTRLDDSTINNNDVTAVAGTPDYQQTGKIGYCVGYVAADNEYNTVPDNNTLDLDQMTIEAWAYSNAYGNDYDRIVAKSTSNNYNLYFRANTAPAPSEAGELYIGAPVAGSIQTGAGDIGTGAWHYIVGTYDRTLGGTEEGKIFINGTKKGTLDNNGIPPTGADDVYFSDSVANRDWNGYIDEIRISNIARNASWLKASFHSTNQTLGFLTWGSEHIEDIEPPTNFVASTYSAHIINLTWTKGDNADYTRIQNKTGSYPTSISDGLLVYNGTLTSYNHTGLTNDTVYYYGAWGYNSTNNRWSAPSINAINYTVVDPTVTTNASTGIEETNATLRAYLSDYGGENCLVWFEYGTLISYGNKTTNQTMGNRTEFNDDATGLLKGTYYHYRAAANNTRSTTYGSDLTFITKPLEPNTLTVTKHNGTTINISWVKGDGANNTRIQNKTGSYPTTYSDGYNVYNSTLTYVLHTGLVGGNTYHYRGWSYAEWNPWSFSDSYDEGTLLLVPDSPYALTAATYGDTWINLSWSKGNGTVNTVIRNDTTAYPIDYNSNNLTYNDTGNYTNTTGLIPSTQYFFRAWSYANGTYNNTYVQVAQYTRPSVPSGFTVSTYNATQTDLAWTKGTGATKTRIQRKIDDYPTSITDGTNIYNNTGASYSNTGLTNATLYYYRAWSYNTASNLYSTLNVSIANLTKPYGPTTINVSHYNATAFDITWTKNTQANTTVIRRYNGSTYPTLTTGILVYNASGTQVYDNNTATNMEYRYTLWSWSENDSYNQYSAPVQITWGFTTFYVYNESDGAAITNWDIFISNSDGSSTYNKTGNTNPLNVNTSDFPTGDPVFMEFAANSYKNRYYYYTLATINNQWYNLSAFLLSEGDTEEDEVLRTASVSVSNSSNDSVITLECIPSRILIVQGYNESLYGHWFEIPEDKYSLVSNVVTVNESVLDANTSLVKVSYYCVGGTYATLYSIIVVNEYDQGIEDVYVRFKRYISTEGAFRNVSILYTDLFGQISIYLQPGVQYKVNMSKTGYVTTEEDYITDPEYYGLGHPKYFKLSFVEEEYENETTYHDAITFEGYMNSTGFVFVNYTDLLNETTSTNICIYEINGTTGNLTWHYWDNRTGNNDFSFNVSGNVSNSYQVVLDLDHVTFGNITDFFIVSYRTGITNETRFDNLFTLIFGHNPFGWHNIFGLFVLIACAFSFGQRNAGVSLMVTGGLMLFINVVIGLSLASVTIWTLFIILGILVQWRNQEKETRG